MNGHDPAESVVLRVLRAALHAGFYLLLGIATARLFGTRDAGAMTFAALGGAVALAALYTVGALPPHRRYGRRAALVWLAGVTGLWALLLLASPDFSWIAFPLFFLHLHLLRRAHAVTAVAVITGLVVTTQVIHAEEVSVAMVLGPSLGAVFAVVMAWGYAAVHAESQQRRRLIEDLRETRAQLAASQHEAGAAAERERLAREIHDTLAQGLSSVVLLLRAAESGLDESPEQARSRIAEARRTASENLEEARGFVRGLRPPDLRQAGLGDALRRLCARTERESGLRCHLRVDGEAVALPPEYEIALLRAAQASLANVVQHARADTAMVTLGYLTRQVTLDVYDDGVGFDPSVLGRVRGDGTGYGLSALGERVELLGGELSVESAEGGGTVVAVRLPFGEEGDR
ncbi:sensor histidine kinase [Actinopolyspora mortivallis]|uniref:Oxygen sensor histidine kinase NreB n=1 Tax=Actinopolyspora mortivallis TaxID=33906 RepID=A0A2T0GYC7_ACTMO|nr:sensor histidine kinase [Actinopolyspora mortivallis]PRW64100.1 sensor histidine kinase [Actinopolyspora mortivallis]